jgi:hypothetical protein
MGQNNKRTGRNKDIDVEKPAREAQVRLDADQARRLNAWSVWCAVAANPPASPFPP